MLEIYLSISVIVGLVVIYDGRLILMSNGVVKSGQLSMITTTIEFLWAIISIIVLFTLEFKNWQVLIPVLYVTHNIIGWVYGGWLASKSSSVEMGEFEIPKWYAKFGFNFGVVFTFGCILVQYQMYS